MGYMGAVRPRRGILLRHTASAHVGVSINVNITNAVTVVHHDTFVRGVRVAAPLPLNPFKTGKIIAGPPLIVPIKASLVAIANKGCAKICCAFAKDCS